MGKRIFVANAAAVAVFTAVSLPVSEASSHREAPAITRSPKVDATDFYAFNSYEPGRSGYVTLIANYIPLQDAYGGPNYFAMDPGALYEIHIDNDGDAVEDLTFRFRFENALANGGEGLTLPIGPPGEEIQVAVPLKNIGPIASGNTGALNFTESYTLELVEGDRRSGVRSSVTGAAGASFGKPFDYIGNKTFSDRATYEAYADDFVHDITVPGCPAAGRVFVGQRKDSFAVNLGETFDLVNYVPIEAGSFPGGIAQDTANDDLRDKNITSFILELPADCLTGDGNGVIGAWTSASLRQVRILNRKPTFEKPEVNGGAWSQVSRLGMPLVNEVVIGLKDKDRFNSAEPVDDGQFAAYVTNPALPELLNILFLDAVNATLGTSFGTLAPTNFPRMDLIATFLTGFAGVNQQSMVTASEMLRLNTAIAATARDEQSPFGVAGDDLAGFPNGRRPGDDVVDIALRVVMGRLCHPVPVNGTDTDLGLCVPGDAEVGTVPFTDGAPISALDFDAAFPYLTTPLAGSPN